MRDNRIVVTVVIVLLSVICMLRPTEATGDVEKQQKVDCGKSIKAVEDQFNQDERDSVNKVLQIDTENLCTADSISNLREFYYTMKKRGNEFLEGTSHLEKVVNECLVEAENCFKTFEKQWARMKKKFEMKFNRAEIINEDDVDLLTDSKIPSIKKDASRLVTVLDYFFHNIPRPIASVYEEPTEDEYKQVHPAYKKYIDDLSAQIDRNKKQPNLSRDRREEILKNYQQPCVDLVNEEESKSILDPVGQLMDILGGTELQPEEGFTFSSFQWAEKYYNCKDKLRRDIKDIARAGHQYLGRLLSEESPKQ